MRRKEFESQLLANQLARVMGGGKAAPQRQQQRVSADEMIRMMGAKL